MVPLLSAGVSETGMFYAEKVPESLFASPPPPPPRVARSKEWKYAPTLLSETGTF